MASRCMFEVGDGRAEGPAFFGTRYRVGGSLKLAFGHGGDAGAAAAAGDFDADEGTFEGEAGAEDVEGFGAAVLAGEALLGALAGGVSALLVDFVGALGGVGEDDDLVVGDLEEAAEDGHGDDFAGDVGEHFTIAEGGHEGGVVGEDGDLALGGGDDEALDVVALEDGAFCGDDAE